MNPPKVAGPVRGSTYSGETRVRVDGPTAAGVDLEVQVRRTTTRVPGITVGPDPLAGRYPAAAGADARKVRVVVLVGAVPQVNGQPTEAARSRSRDRPRVHGVDADAV